MKLIIKFLKEKNLYIPVGEYQIFMRSFSAGRVFRGLSGLFAALALVRGFTPARPVDISTLNVVDRVPPTAVTSPLAEKVAED